MEENQKYATYYTLQTELAKRVIREDQLSEHIQFVAGADVAYDDANQETVGAIVVLNAETLEVVESATHRMETTFPYVPGLFSFREIPVLLEAYKKLIQKPQLLVCDGQGIAHPKRVGMASHLGVELDIPTIGCAKKRLLGAFDKTTLGEERGSHQELIEDEEIIGTALRTRDGIKPVFVSIGHKVSLETAINWVLHLTPNYRQPETTRAADHLVNKILKDGIV